MCLKVEPRKKESRWYDLVSKSDNAHEVEKQWEDHFDTTP
ncbi:unnamed protein product [Rotaria sordida]|uniref:Uncharacterized protein n=1 Tax=Rotaria sordida TaxID=392033 RepID=A0A815VZ20_9BILA|nr:unnamed protein product [Rotaria sordida]